MSLPGSVGEQVLSDPIVQARVPRLRRLCGRAEYLLERQWAQSIATAHDPQHRLLEFPYLRNYQQLGDLELHLLAGVGCDLSRLNRIGFLGGGPLPVSALILAQRLDVSIDIVDRNPEASGLADLVIERLDLSPRLRTWTVEAVQFVEAAECDIIFFAALVGADQIDKRRILAGLAERVRPGCHLVARGAHGLRTLLYPAIDVADLPGWTPLACVQPFTEVVNSVLVATRR